MSTSISNNHRANILFFGYEDCRKSRPTNMSRVHFSVTNMGAVRQQQRFYQLSYLSIFSDNNRYCIILTSVCSVIGTPDPSSFKGDCISRYYGYQTIIKLCYRKEHTLHKSPTVYSPTVYSTDDFS